MTLNEAIIEIRVALQESKLKKSGANKFAGFDYFELADFLPTLNKLMNENKVNDIFSIKDGNATLTLIKGNETQTYVMPFILFETPLNKGGQKSMQDIQYLGALNTYYKRYLYLNAFGITDGDVIDAMDNSDSPVKLATDRQKKELSELCDKLSLDKGEILKATGWKKGEPFTEDVYAKALVVIQEQTK